MTASEIYFHNKHIEKFLFNLQAIVRLTDSPLQGFRLYGKVISSLVLSKVYLFLFKSVFSFMTDTPEHHENGKKMYDTACQIREYFVETVRISHSKALLLPFRKMIEHAATDWDDFIEDCIVASDPELHHLLGQLTSPHV